MNPKQSLSRRRRRTLRSTVRAFTMFYIGVRGPIRSGTRLFRNLHRFHLEGPTW